MIFLPKKARLPHRLRRQRDGAPVPLASLALAGLVFTWGIGCTEIPTPLAPGLSGSIGVPHNGVLTEALELPRQGVGYVRFRPTSPVYHGLPRLVRAIERAAKVTAELSPPGAPLVVGDLSAESGGKIPRHNSHRTGRDVDFLFFVTAPNGSPMRNPGFFPLEADGLVRFPDGTYGVLDVPRQWLFLRTLLLDREIDVQFLFMSKLLEARLIEYALASGEDLELIWHAETVMLQPGDSLPHADHVHLRIACTPEETIAGCSGGGPQWPWLSPLPELTGSLEQLLAQIKRTDPFELPPLSPDTNPPPASSERVAHGTGAVAEHL